ncbi:MAG: hypothetical protein LBM87_05840 [Ruminococcus sp.]|jgi:hypothetical protein|nr:hypothetical protein [Ruminococcus sp.]
MKNKFKRIFAGVCSLALVMQISASVTAEDMPVSDVVDEAVMDEYISYPSYNPQNSSSDLSDVDLQTALTKVKQRITVPAKLSEFTYDTRTRNNVTSYVFTWTPKKGTDGYSEIVPLDNSEKTLKSIAVTIVGDTITQYNENYSNVDNSPSIGDISYTEFEATANRLIDGLNPGLSKKIKLEPAYASLDSQDIEFSFSRENDDISVKGNQGHITFDKDTGRLSSFSVTWWDNATFRAAKDSLPEETIKKNFEADIDLDLYYVISQNWKDKTYKTALIYSPEDNYNFDAFTGKESTYWEDYAKAMQTTVAYPTTNDYGVAYEEDAVLESSDSDAGVTFTPQERKAIEENDKFLSRDEAQAKVKADKYIKLTDEYKLSNATLYTQEDFAVHNFWQMSWVINTDGKYAEISARVNADTGVIESFNQYYYEKQEKTTEEQAKEEPVPELDVAKSAALADEVMKYYIPDLAAEYVPLESNTKEIYRYGDKKQYYETSRNFMYERFHDSGYGKIKVANNAAHITVNSLGEVSSFNYDYQKVTFPEGKFLNQDDTYKKIWEQVNFDKYYEGFTDLEGKAHTYLTYSLNSFYADAFTGKLCSYSGDIYTDDPVVDMSDGTRPYLDIRDNAAKDSLDYAVTVLHQYGLSLSADNKNFNKDAAVSGSEFFSSIMQVLRGYNNYDDSLDAITEKKAITREDAAKIYVYAIGSVEAAQIPGIFKSPYDSVKDTDPAVGYIAIAKAKGVFDGVTDFKATDKFTRAETIMFVYNLVK